jgi:hypothetical protein
MKSEAMQHKTCSFEAMVHGTGKYSKSAGMKTRNATKSVSLSGIYWVCVSKTLSRHEFMFPSFCIGNARVSFVWKNLKLVFKRI